MPDRLDRALVARGLAATRGRARQLITAGEVRVDGAVIRRPARPVDAAADVAVTTPAYVSRAAYKLIGALADLDVTPAGRALDAGSSTGGFTQVLLERGCREVTAVDVGTDQLAPLLRADPRVAAYEQTNLRELTRAHVGGVPVDLTVADVSFISLTLLVDRLAAVTRDDGTLLLMVKPQFEVGREALGKGGVVRDRRQHGDAVRAVVQAAARTGWRLHGVAPSRLPGPAGNQEFFVCLRTTIPATVTDPADVLR